MIRRLLFLRMCKLAIAEMKKLSKVKEKKKKICEVPESLSKFFFTSFSLVKFNSNLNGTHVLLLALISRRVRQMEPNQFLFRII